MSKQQLGQFFTTNAKYILQGLEYCVINKECTDPFAGNGDLIKWAKENQAKSIIGYDIDSKYVDNKDILRNDSILNPSKYKFVITNPPYLYVNKANKEVKERYFKHNNFDDLYLIAINSILESEEGILIVPINFLSAQNSKEIRKKFLEKFEIVKINYFKNNVFADTTINVIALYYKKKEIKGDINNIETIVFPEKNGINIKIEKKYNWIIGGDFLKKIERQTNLLNIYRLEAKHLMQGNNKIKVAKGNLKFENIDFVDDKAKELIEKNIILLKAIDSGSKEGKIALDNIKKYDIDALISKQTSRHQIHLIFKNKIKIEEQERIIELFNNKIEELREQYFSLFLTNYRDNDRKRISFNFTYKLINYLYFNEVKNGKKQSILF